MKVMIMKCSDNSLWYKDKIGKVYKVDKVQQTHYLAKDGGIKKEDCEVVED